MDQLAPASAPQIDKTSASPEEAIPFRFTGTASEYFGIWIVNLLLTVSTLGVYSAWAKVRRKQYFYRNTHIGDSSLEYLADPIPILKGRLIIAAVLGLVFASQYVSVGLYLGMLLFVFLATPWVLVKALAFNARNSAFRNVRFSFRGTLGDSYKAYLLGFAAYVFTLGLGFPVLQWKVSRFSVDGHRYGSLSMRFRTGLGAYFKVFLIAAASIAAFLIVVVVGLGVAAALGAPVAPTDTSGEPAAPGTAFYVGLFGIYAFMVVPIAYFRARIANLFWGGIDVGPHRLESTQTFREVLVLIVTNLLGIAFSLGLATPWAVIRSLRYRVEHLTIHASGPLVVESDRQRDEPGAFGDAATDLGDFDFDFG